MQKLKPIQILVPGTSANLGPGFDILGIAWKIYNEFSFRFEKNEFQVSMRNGEELPFPLQDDLVYSSYHKYFSVFLPNKTIPPYQCKMRLNLPLKGGLGSSASAVVAGFTLAREVHKQIYMDVSLPSESKFLYELALIEGHPDNTIPAYLGGYVLSYFSGKEKLHYFKKRFPRSISTYIFCPHIPISTNESRKNLPQYYKTEDIIFNMARIATWMQFFETRKFGDLLLAIQDKIHTEYRLQGMPYLKKIIDLIQKKQMGFCLSGSGPSLLIFIPRKNAARIWGGFEAELKELANQENIKYSLFKVLPDQNGCIINRW